MYSGKAADPDYFDRCRVLYAGAGGIFNTAPAVPVAAKNHYFRVQLYLYLTALDLQHRA